MNFLYVVTWTLQLWVSDPCPDRVRVDEFGRGSFYGCIVDHGHYESGATLTRNFASRDSAFTFYKLANQEQDVGELINVRIDSVEIQWQLKSQ